METWLSSVALKASVPWPHLSSAPLFPGPRGITRWLLWDWPSSREDRLQLLALVSGELTSTYFSVPVAAPALELVQRMLLLLLAFDASPPLPTLAPLPINILLHPSRLGSGYHFYEAFFHWTQPGWLTALSGLPQVCVVFHYNLCSSLLCSLVHSFQIWKPINSCLKVRTYVTYFCVPQSAWDTE